jgi:hypothetical protein
MHSTRSPEGLSKYLLEIAGGVDAESGLLRGARQVPSPNFDARPDGILPELIVVHGISLPPNQFGGPWIDRLFTNTLPPHEHPYFVMVKSCSTCRFTGAHGMREPRAIKVASVATISPLASNWRARTRLLTSRRSIEC